MHRKLVIAGIAVAVAIAVPGAATGDAAKTRVDIVTYSQESPTSGQFQGEVKSKKDKCHEKRKVNLYRDDPGGPVKIGSAKTISGEGSSVFIIDDPNPPSGNPYYAIAPAVNGCKKDRSKDFVLP